MNVVKDYKKTSLLVFTLKKIQFIMKQGISVRNFIQHSSIYLTQLRPGTNLDGQNIHLLLRKILNILKIVKQTDFRVGLVN